VELNEKAVSKKQQRFFGMVRAAQKGEGAASPEVAQVAADISKKDAKDFASTKHKGLPEKKKVEEGVMDIVRKYSKKKEEKKPQKATDAGARARRKLQRREYKDKVSSIVPSELEDQKSWVDFRKHFHI
jgi:hypothetical protein